jgi:hypothetical protein
MNNELMVLAIVASLGTIGMALLTYVAWCIGRERGRAESAELLAAARQAIARGAWIAEHSIANDGSPPEAT